MKMQGWRQLTSVIFATAMTVSALSPVSAAESQSASSSNQYFYDQTVNAGLDTGFAEKHSITKDDPHFGWSLGSFVAQGFTSKKDGDVPVFFKNTGDEVTLSYVLKQDINALNGNSKVTIANDKKGYDEHFGVSESEFGRGTLIVRFVNYQNASEPPMVYKDYLSGVTANAETQVRVLEEGDYEVALDYEIESPSSIPLRSTLNNYQSLFRFKVRNSNSMMFLLDKESGTELYNGSATENGFRIDLAGSRFLTLNVQKQVLNATGDGLVEDTRFNRSATDGAEFTEEGIYTITVRSDSNTEEPTTKRIYVGHDRVLKASVVNSLDIASIRKRLSEGETIDAEGNLVLVSNQQNADGPSDTASDASDPRTSKVTVGGIIVVAVLALFGTIILMRRRRQANSYVNLTTQKSISGSQPALEKVRSEDN